MEKTIHRLQGLEGTNQKFTEAVFIESPSEISELLDSGYACTSAGDNGAINIWKGTDGLIRCEAMRFCISQDKQTFKSIEVVEQWVKSWLKSINC